jgi:TPR repeat protein
MTSSLPASKRRWGSRFIGKLNAWLDATLKTPSTSEMHAGLLNSDYDQAGDSAIWEAEIDPERLDSALRMSPDSEAALAELLDLALTGSVIAMMVVGERCYWGQGAPRNEAKGEAWLRKAADGGSQRALLSYGRILFGRGDLEGARAVFQTGADQDWPPALCWIAAILLRQATTSVARQEARRLLERAMAKGSPRARFMLARNMLIGRFGLNEIPRGLQLAVAYSRETSDAFDAARKAPARVTAAGETLH